jgi:ferric-dicitrate binding protein FerR (iron transport regulator)
MSPDDFDAHLDSRLRDTLANEPLLGDVSLTGSRIQLDALHRRIAGDARIDQTLPASVRPVGPRRTWPAENSWRARSWSRAIIAVMMATVLIVVGWRGVTGRDRATRRMTSTVYATRYGQRATVALADGSQITLAPASTLRLERGRGPRDGIRAILHGEAYFALAHQTNTPFVVMTDAISTRVLGTSFDVRHYPGDRTVRVVVREGKVNVGVATSGAPAVSVTAGMIASVTDSTAETVTAGDVSNYTAWSDGVLTFRRMRTSEVLETLGQWYGYQFKWRDSTLASHLLTVRFDGESEATVLRSLGVILDVTMTFDGRVVTLTPRSSAMRGAADATSKERRAVPTQYMEVGR